MQFSSAVTYNMFVTLGLITAVPVSGGKLSNYHCNIIFSLNHINLSATFFFFLLIK